MNDLINTCAEQVRSTVGANLSVRTHVLKFLKRKKLWINIVKQLMWILVCSAIISTIERNVHLKKNAYSFMTNQNFVSLVKHVRECCAMHV